MYTAATSAPNGTSTPYQRHGHCPKFQLLELIVGARNKEEIARTDKFLSDYVVVPLQGSTGGRAYELLKNYAKSNGLHVFDSLIAATAIEENLTLVTRNRKHFSMIHGLSLQVPQILEFTPKS